MKTENAIKIYERLESIRDNQGVTFCPNMTPFQNRQFSRIGLALLNASLLKPIEHYYPVKWRGRFYPENLTIKYK